MWFSIVYGSRKSYCIFRLSSAAIKPNPSYFSSVLYSWSFNSTIWPCSLLLNFSRKPGRRSPSCAKMTPANPTMKGLEL